MSRPPLYHEQKLELITDFLGLKNDAVNYDTICFEKDGLEAKFGRQPTSFDFYFETKTENKIQFEIKYTENEFGKANINLDKFDKVYSKYLQPLNSKFHKPQFFFDNYQILRNLIHINNNSFVVFVYPKGNKGICNGVERVKTEFLIKNYHDRFIAATWEKLFESVSISATNVKLKTQLTDFKNKYLSY